MKLFNDKDFIHEEEFEANLYALLYDPSPLDFQDPSISQQDKLFMVINTLLSLTNNSVVNRLGQINRQLNKIFTKSETNLHHKV